MKMEAGSISQAIRKFCKFLLSSVEVMTPAPESIEMNRLCTTEKGYGQQISTGWCKIQ